MTQPKGDWWNDNVGQNMLAGVEDDPDNIPVLPGYAITDMLRRIPAARAAFNRMVPNMLPEEQERYKKVLRGYDAVTTVKVMLVSWQLKEAHEEAQH